MNSMQELQLLCLFHPCPVTFPALTAGSLGAGPALVCAQLVQTGFWFWSLKWFFNRTQGIFKSDFSKLAAGAVGLGLLCLPPALMARCPLRAWVVLHLLVLSSSVACWWRTEKSTIKMQPPAPFPSESQRSWCINTPGFSPQPHFPVLAGLFILGNQFAHPLIGRVRLSTHILQKKERQDEELFVAVRGLGRLLGDRPCGR